MKKTYIKNTLAVQTFKFHLIIMCFFFCGLRESKAYQPEEGMLRASVGSFLHHGDFRSRPDAFYDKTKLGLSLVTEVVIAKNLALEFGFFYLRKPYLRQEDNRFLVEELNRLYITTGVRRWWSTFFSTGLNLFSSFSMGDPVVVASSGLITEDFDTLARRDSAAVYGLDVSTRFEVALNPKDSIFLDFRYSYSLSSESNDEANHMLLGLFYSREIRVK